MKAGALEDPGQLSLYVSILMPLSDPGQLSLYVSMPLSDTVPVYMHSICHWLQGSQVLSEHIEQ